MIKFLKRLFCSHDYQPAGRTCHGATMSWSGSPTPSYSFHRDCSKCEKRKTRHGRILPRSWEIATGRKYDEHGWPLDDDGNQLPIART